jgi:hypothetical protein
MSTFPTRMLEVRVLQNELFHLQHIQISLNCPRSFVETALRLRYPGHTSRHRSQAFWVNFEGFLVTQISTL